MNLSWSDDQQLLIDSAERFATRYYTAEVRAASRGAADGASPAVWRDLAEMGWLGVAVADAHGGFGGGALETGILAEAAGRCLLLEPWLASAVQASAVLRALPGSAAAGALLSGIAEGSLRVALAHVEQAQDPQAPVQARASAQPGGWRLDGRKRFVLDAAPQHWLCSAVDSASGQLMLFLLPAKAPGLQCQAFPALDDRQACHLVLDGVLVQPQACVAEGAAAQAALEQADAALRLALCHEALGAMEVLLRDTLAYTQTRQQFGRPLAANQVLRHRLVDMAVAIRESRALTLRAAILQDQADASPLERQRALLGATAKATLASRLLAEEAIQMHGAMGVTEELPVGLYVKRLLLCQMVWGPLPVQHAARAALDAQPPQPTPEKETA